MRHYLRNFLVITLSFTILAAFGQEYDDLYFTQKDRQKDQKNKTEVADESFYQNSETTDDENLSFLGRQYQYNFQSTGDVSDKSLDYYKPDKTPEDYQVDNDYGVSDYQNSNFSNSQITNDDNYDNTVPQQVIVNNYYNDNWNTWNRPRMRFGMGWNSWGGNFWSVSYGNAWGNSWYDPWRSSWGWNSWAYNPWGWGGGFSNSFWCPPGYYGNNFGYGRSVYVVGSNESRGRAVTRGARPSRGSTSTRSSRSSSGRSLATSGESSSRVDRSRQQANYLNRSRSNRHNSGNSRGSSSINSRSTNSNSVSSVNTRGRTNTNTNVSRSRSTPSRSYSPPASRSSRSSSTRSSPSRSSSSVGRSSSSSSSRSSGSRSSSGRSSSGRRGGN